MIDACLTLCLFETVMDRLHPAHNLNEHYPCRYTQNDVGFSRATYLTTEVGYIMVVCAYFFMKV